MKSKTPIRIQIIGRSFISKPNVEFQSPKTTKAIDVTEFLEEAKNKIKNTEESEVQIPNEENRRDIKDRAIL